MRPEPAFTFTATVTLALGIGLTTAIFSVAYGVLWRPLPFDAPLTGRGEPWQVHAVDVSPNLFATLGVTPVRNSHAAR